MKVNLIYATPIQVMISGLCTSYDKRPEDYIGREQEALATCLNHANVHTMPLEMSLIQFRIETKIAVSRELNRHRPLKIIERSTRYVEMTYEDVEISGGLKDNLSGIFDLGGESPAEIATAVSRTKYCELIKDHSVPKQFARDILPLTTKTVEVVCGSLWDWIKFIKSRAHKTAHPDIREIAVEIYRQLNFLYPMIVNKENLEAVHPIKLEI